MIYKLTIYQKRDAAKQKTSIIYITSHKSLSPFAVSMSKFLTGFDCSCWFVVEMLWKCLISSKISLSNSRSNMKVRVGQFTFFPIRYPIKAKKMDGNPNFHCGSLEDFREIFIFIFPGIRSKSWTSTNTANGDNQVSHIYMVLFYIMNRQPYFVTLV